MPPHTTKNPPPSLPSRRRRTPRSIGLILALLAAAVSPAAGALETAVAQRPQDAAPSLSGATARPQPRADHVLAISLDGLTSRALTKLGRSGTPHLWRLLDHGAHTLNARAAVERTETLPNHTGMVTGRVITASQGGHGVTWNDDRRSPLTVQEAAGHPVASVFSKVHAAGGSTALFTTKTKLSLFERSWPAAVDRTVIADRADAAVADAAVADLATHGRDLTFVHLGAADKAGHGYGFMSTRYLDAVRHLDALVGRLVATVEKEPGLARTVVVLTADHGGAGVDHYDPAKLANYRIPFLVWGDGVGTSPLYTDNPRYRNPGTERIAYGVSPGPVRNGDLANLSLDLLGLGPVPGSTLNRDQVLHVG